MAPKEALRGGLRRGENLEAGSPRWGEVVSRRRKGAIGCTFRNIQSTFQNGGGGCCSPDSSSPAVSVPGSLIVTPGGRAHLFCALFKAPPPFFLGGGCLWAGPGNWGKCVWGGGAGGMHQRRLTLAPLSFCVAPSRTRQTVYVSLPVNSPPPPTASHKSSLLGVCLGTSAWAARV